MEILYPSYSMHKIIFAVGLLFAILIAISYQRQSLKLSTGKACMLTDWLYEELLIAPWPNGNYETKNEYYHISQFYKYKERLSYPITVKAKWWAQLWEEYEDRFYFYSYNCQTKGVNSIDEDNDYGLFETKILEAKSGTMLIRHDDVNNPKQIWLKINDNGKIEKDNVSDNNSIIQSNFYNS